jgi:hypothetical protein
VSGPGVVLLYVKVVVEGTDNTVIDPLNPVGTRPAIVNVSPTAIFVGVGVVHVTMVDNKDAVNVVDIVGKTPFPMMILLDPAVLNPFDVPMKIFDVPPPDELPPILIVFEIFERPVALHVPMRMEL